MNKQFLGASKELKLICVTFGGDDNKKSPKRKLKGNYNPTLIFIQSFSIYGFVFFKMKCPPFPFSMFPGSQYPTYLP